jgi:ribosome-associated protein
MGLVHKKDMKKSVKPGQEQEEQPVRLSKTQKKKAALSLQDLGGRLVKLSNEQLKQMDLPEDVLAAVKAAKAIKKHGPLSRQMQHIGSLMRKHDPAPVREFLDALERGTAGKPRSASKKNDDGTA